MRDQGSLPYHPKAHLTTPTNHRDHQKLKPTFINTDLINININIINNTNMVIDDVTSPLQTTAYPWLQAHRPVEASSWTSGGPWPTGGETLW